jgi:hypothetical protein
VVEGKLRQTPGRRLAGEGWHRWRSALPLGLRCLSFCLPKEKLMEVGIERANEREDRKMGKWVGPT